MSDVTIPGFVDLQVNGYLGVDFSSPELTRERAAMACRRLLSAGTAAFLPTVITSPPAIYERNLAILADLIESDEFQGTLPGIHLEGPFISSDPGAAGAHRPEWTQQPDTEAFDQLQCWARGHIRLVTLAAELPGAAAVTRHCRSTGVTVSLGHQLAGELELMRLADAGASALTHLGNGVPQQLPRHANPIWAGLGADDLSAMLIIDGIHLPASLIKVMVRAKGVDRIIVVSDASPVTGLPPGRYQLMHGEVALEPDGRAHLPGHPGLAGSSFTILRCMNYLASLDLLEPEDLLRVGIHNPCRLIGIEPDFPARPGGAVWRYESDCRRFVNPAECSG